MLINDGTGNFVTPEEYHGYKVEHTTRNQFSSFDFYGYLNLDYDDVDDLTDDAREALEALCDAFTELDYENGNRYYLNLSDDEVSEALDRFLPRLFDDSGNALTNARSAQPPHGQRR